MVAGTKAPIERNVQCVSCLVVVARHPRSLAGTGPHASAQLSAPSAPPGTTAMAAAFDFDALDAVISD